MTKDELIQFEKRVEERWIAGKVRVPLHLSGGNENDLLHIFKNIKEDDWVISTHRNHYHYLLKGGDADGLFKEIIGESTGICRGNSGSMHTTDMERRFISSCLVGCGAPIAVGVATGIKLRSGQERVWCFLGDGACDQGMFWEALHTAEGRDLPVTFVVEDNNRSVDTSCEERGVSSSSSRLGGLMLSSKVIYYKFEATRPHVGNGEHVSF